MKYVITDTSVIRLAERSGVIQNLGNDKIELSDNQNFADSIVLPMLNKFSFSDQLYIRAYSSKVDNTITVNVVPFALDNGGGASSSVTVEDDMVTTDAEADEYFDSIFGDDTPQTVDDEDVATDAEADEYFDSIFGN